MPIRKGSKKPVGSIATRVAYLLGAGATHAELADACSEQMLSEIFLERNSLLLASVSKRVCRDASQAGELSKQIRSLLSSSGLSNIELFISLLEENHIEKAAEVVQSLKARIKRDIQQRIRRWGRRFYLHKALLELHGRILHERLTGIISLNYDNVMDDAFETLYRTKPDYCLSSIEPKTRTAPPLLKLHGGFDLTYRNKKLPIITPGVYKNYLELPYNFVWGRALELLLECDILRVIGCSLSANDIGIVDLLFKAHINRRDPFLIQVIDFDPRGNRIKEQFGFFPRIERATEIEKGIISDVLDDPEKGSNPFKIWLKAKIERTVKDTDISRTRFIRKVLE